MSIRKASEAITALITELRDRGITIELPWIGIIPIKIGPVVKSAGLPPDLLSAARHYRRRLDAMGLSPEQVEEAITRIASGNMTMDVVEAAWRAKQKKQPTEEPTP